MIAGTKYVSKKEDGQNNEGDLVDNSTPTEYEIASTGYMTTNLDNWTPCVTVQLGRSGYRTYSKELFLTLFKEKP
jgi:hypothetical protein